MFKHGMKRPEGAGRKKGTPNKASLRVLDALEAEGVNPLKEVLTLLRGGIIDDEQRLNGWLKLMTYCYPTLKSIEVSGELDTGGVIVTQENVAALCRIAREATLPPKDEAS